MHFRLSHRVSERQVKEIVPLEIDGLRYLSARR